MTPEERAEKMVQAVLVGITGSHFEFFLSHLRAAVEEAILYHPLIEDQIIAKSNLAFEKGKQVAYEDAAQIANKFADSTGSAIYEEIRARAREVGK